MNHNLKEKVKTTPLKSFQECLSQMGVKGGENSGIDGSSFQDFTNKKLTEEAVFFIKDEVYVFFFEQEKKLWQYLLQLLTKRKQTIIL